MISIAQSQGLNKGHLVPYQQHWLQPDTRDAFLAMQQQAQREHVDIQLVSSYRDFYRQLSIWNRKWRGELPLYDLEGQQLDAGSMSASQKMHAILLWSALPGASRHHWGTDMDVYDKHSVTAANHAFQLISSEYQPGGPCYQLAAWLDKYAGEFGFYRPYASYQGGVAAEPWHISYYPEATKNQHLLDINSLRNTIAGAEMAGKELVLTKLPEIFERYIINLSDYG